MSSEAPWKSRATSQPADPLEGDGRLDRMERRVLFVLCAIAVVGVGFGGRCPPYQCLWRAAPTLQCYNVTWLRAASSVADGESILCGSAETRIGRRHL